MSTATVQDEPDTPGVEFKVPPFGELGMMGELFPRVLDLTKVGSIGY